ncbi:MAG: biotin/lipoyl-containing protein, partial [bacterium]
VGTRDCSLQRRNQKLVEEAPAPFLSDEQRASIAESAKAICRRAGYTGAGTVEYLVAHDGAISFLEVNTRLQVEHPVTEETSGIDLVRAQFRIAEGEPLGFVDDPQPRGHSIEFRINGEDAGRNFLPAPGTVTEYVPPAGPGVRVDSGVEADTVIGGAFDSLLAKLIVTGATRTEALERARRALTEFRVEGLATVLPFHRAVVRDPAFTAEPFAVFTRWIESEFDNTIAPFDGTAQVPAEAEPRETVVVEVGGKRLEVSLPAGFAGGAGGGSAGNGSTRKAAPKRSAGRRSAAAASGTALAAPMQGTLVKVAVADGDEVAAGDLIVVLEAMKMEQPINAHKGGTVAKLSAEVGAVVSAGSVICEITD